MKKLIAMLGMVVACLGSITAQTTDKNLLGLWILESMQYEGEDKIVCGAELGYGQIKYYGADGEYACAQLTYRDGQVAIHPHEYGTYTYKDSVYTEMGRATVEDALVLVDKETFTGHFFKRRDVWKKSKMPQHVVDEILNYCKLVKLGLPAETQKIIGKHMFGK